MTDQIDGSHGHEAQAPWNEDRVMDELGAILDLGEGEGINSTQPLRVSLKADREPLTIEFYRHTWGNPFQPGEHLSVDDRKAFTPVDAFSSDGFRVEEINGEWFVIFKSGKVIKNDSRRGGGEMTWQELKVPADRLSDMSIEHIATDD